jgi:hypothetical protein
MKPDLEKSLVEDFPQLFRDYHGDVTKTCMAFGCDCGDGWFEIIRDACEKMMAVGLEPDTVFAQIKEKCGGLRLYMYGATSEIYDIASAAEEESCKVCESCGSRENVNATSEGSWVSTLCKECRGKPHS